MPAVYNRSKSLAYARKFWTRVSSDGYVALNANPPYKSVPLASLFVRPAGGAESLNVPGGPAITSNLDDCAHFVSCCIGAEAAEIGGGLPLERAFPAGPYGQLSANQLFMKVMAQGFGTEVGVKLGEAAALAALSQLDRGDLIFYHSAYFNAYRHCGLWLAETGKRIACHTRSRCDQSNETGQEWNSVKFAITRPDETEFVETPTYTLVKLP